MTIGKLLTESALTLIVPGRNKPFVISRDHKLFVEILKAANNKDIDTLLKLIDIAERVNVISDGRVEIKNGQVIYKGEVVSSLIAERILELHSANLDFSYMTNFLEKLMKNPSYTSRQELYLFLENGNMPILEDGRFLAYKWVRDDFKDCHSGKFDNSPGQIVKMDRSKVDDNRQNTCSAGLHVCTHGYTKFGERLVLVAIDPADVVSVPYDYNNAKMRVSQYEVLKEVTPEEYTKFTSGFATYGDDEGYDDEGYDDEGYDDEGYDEFDDYDDDENDVESSMGQDNERPTINIFNLNLFGKKKK